MAVCMYVYVCMYVCKCVNAHIGNGSVCIGDLVTQHCFEAVSNLRHNQSR